MSTPSNGKPIVLVHGIFGFGQLKVAGVTVVDYFRGIPQALRAAGYSVPQPPSLNTAGSIVERAIDLKRYLESEPGVSGQQVHLIAHSLGGLDARYMISRLGMADRVLSLTTIGTPHQGSPIADVVVKAGFPGVQELLNQLGVDLKGISDLTTAACRQFNTEVLDVPKVQYFCIAGKFEPPRLLNVPLGLLGVSHDIIASEQRDNDGMVSVQSAAFLTRQPNWQLLETWTANHFRLINWGSNILPTLPEEMDQSIVDNYLRLAARLNQLKR
jgi:triacylglycerol lipase